MKRSTSLSIAAAAAILGVSSLAAAQYPQQPVYPQQQPYPQQPVYPQQQPYPQQPTYPQQPGYGAPLTYTFPFPNFGYGAPAPAYNAPPASTPPPAPTFLSEAMQSRVALQLDWFNSSPKNAQALNVLTWDLVAQIGVTENIVLDADIPWSYTGLSSSFSKAVFGLPILGAHLAARFAPSAAFSIGMGIGIPVQGSMNAEGKAAASLAGSLRGYQDLLRFYPGQLPLRFRGALELEAKPFFLQADLAPAFLISLGNSQSTIVTLDQGTNAGVRTGVGLLAGLRLQESFFLTRADDHVQIAIEPFVGYERPGKSGLIARYGLLMPLDGVEGFAFDQRKLLTNRFSVGAKF